MLTTERAKEVLTKEQRKHLTKMGIFCVEVFASNRIQQNSMRQASLAAGMPIEIAEPCWECCHIARKLEIWVP